VYSRYPFLTDQPSCAGMHSYCLFPLFEGQDEELDGGTLLSDMSTAIAAAAAAAAAAASNSSWCCKEQEAITAAAAAAASNSSWCCKEQEAVTCAAAAALARLAASETAEVATITLKMMQQRL
jgi:hypothetical protein